MDGAGDVALVPGGGGAGVDQGEAGGAGGQVGGDVRDVGVAGEGGTQEGRRLGGRGGRHGEDGGGESPVAAGADEVGCGAALSCWFIGSNLDSGGCSLKE